MIPARIFPKLNSGWLMEAALAEDPLLRAQLERIEEERMATIADAEAMPLPSRQMADRLFAEIAATAPVPRPSWSERLFAPLGDWLAFLADLLDEE